MQTFHIQMYGMVPASPMTSVQHSSIRCMQSMNSWLLLRHVAGFIPEAASYNSARDHIMVVQSTMLPCDQSVTAFDMAVKCRWCYMSLTAVWLPMPV